MRDKFDKDAKFEIIQPIAVLSTNEKGWTLEFNRVKWGEREPVYEVRRWGPNHSIVGKGITLYVNELLLLMDALKSLK